MPTRHDPPPSPALQRLIDLDVVTPLYALTSELADGVSAGQTVPRILLGAHPAAYDPYAGPTVYLVPALEWGQYLGTSWARANLTAITAAYPQHFALLTGGTTDEYHAAALLPTFGVPTPGLLDNGMTALDAASLTVTLTAISVPGELYDEASYMTLADELTLASWDGGLGTEVEVEIRRTLQALADPHDACAILDLAAHNGMLRTIWYATYEEKYNDHFPDTATSMVWPSFGDCVADIALAMRLAAELPPCLPRSFKRVVDVNIPVPRTAPETSSDGRSPQ